MTISSFDEAERHLDRAWYAALIAATFDLIVGAMVILGTRVFTLGAAVYISGVVLMLLLAYGVARRSRAAAVILLLVGILRMGFEIRLGTIVRVIVGGALVYFYARGVQGAFAYHRLRVAGSPQLPPTRRASA